jgi:hypothetical protein
MPRANDKQISGKHYLKQKIQSWDFIAANRLDFFQGSAITYIARFRDKGGKRDLEKAIHFLEKLIELEYGEEGEEEAVLRANRDMARLYLKEDGSYSLANVLPSESSAETVPTFSSYIDHEAAL